MKQRQKPRQKPAVVALAPALILSAAIAGCSSKPKSNPYFGRADGRGPVAVADAPSETFLVQEFAAPVMGQDIVDTPQPFTHAAPVAPAAPTQVAAVPAAASRWGTGWIPISRFASELGVGPLHKTVSGDTSYYSVPTRNGVFVFTMGHKLARLNGINVWLGFPPQVVGGEPCVNGLDVEKTLQPICDSQSLAARSVVIDPGHGGADSGTRGTRGEKEKDFTLDWALRTERLLTNAGWRVTLTRRSDLDTPLPSRVAFADQERADLFISLHFNSAAPNNGPSGIETYCLTPVGMASTLVRGYSDDTRIAFANNLFDKANLQLAYRLQWELVTETRAVDHGVRRARFMGVLRTQNRPAVLIEGGYLSNTAEMSRIASAEYRQRLAEAVFRALR